MRRTDKAVGRLRSHLTPSEAERLLDAAGRTQNALRDRTLVLLMVRHALRLSEAIDLRWDVDVDLERRTLLPHRLKRGRTGLHPLLQDEFELMLQLRDASPGSTYVFPSSLTGQRLNRSVVNRLFQRLGREIGLCVPSARKCCGIRPARSSWPATGL
jgi:integrase